MSAGLWENARRSLARLFARAEIHALPLEQTAPGAVVYQPEEIGHARSAPGAQEVGWQPVAAIQKVQAPSAETGSQEARLRPDVVIAEDCAGWGTSVEVAHSLPLPSGAMALVQEVPGIRKWEAALRVLDASPVRREPARIFAPRLLLGLKPAVLRRELWEFTNPSVQAGLLGMARIPVTRRRLAMPSGLAALTVFTAEKRQLSATANVPLDDLILLGLYPNLPVAAVQRLVVEESGRTLRFWLKPEALPTLASQRQVTLAVGRCRSTGRIVQAVL